MPRDVTCNTAHFRVFNAGPKAGHVQWRYARLVRHPFVVVVLLLLLLACLTSPVLTSAQGSDGAQCSVLTHNAHLSPSSALSDAFIPTFGNELALRYTFGVGNLVLVLSENGFLHAYHQDSGDLAWSTDVGGDMISVEVDMPPSRDTILRDPLALPFLVRGNSLFTRIPFYTYNPAPSSNLNTVELLGNLPDLLRPHFFMNISTLLRRQTVFFGGTDIFVTTSVEVADLDSSTGHHINQQHRGGRRVGKHSMPSHTHVGQRSNVSSSASSSVHNELFPVLHVVRYNIVLHVVKAEEYSWSITLAQLQLSPRTSLSAMYRRAAATSTATKTAELKEYNGEANPRFFSHLMRKLFDYDAEHSGRSSSNPVHSTQQYSSKDSNLSEDATELPPEVTAAAMIATLERRRKQMSEYVSRVMSMQQFNNSHIGLLNLLESTTTWTATLPSLSRAASSSFGTGSGDGEGREESTSPPSSLASAQAVASYVWVGGADQIFRIPVQRSADLSVTAPEKSGEEGVYVESPPEATDDAQGRLRLTSASFAGAVMPTQGTLGGLQLVPFLHRSDSADMSHAFMALDVEGDEREGAELDRYYHERSWWESQGFTSSSSAGTQNVDNLLMGFSNSGDVVRTGLAWHTAGIISFHVLCLAGSIAFLCAGVPPRNQLQRAWAQADRNRDRLSHNSVSRPQSTQLVPQDLLSGGGGSGGVRSPFSPVVDGFLMDSPAQAVVDAAMRTRSPSPARLDESEEEVDSTKEAGATDEMAGDQNTATSHKWDDRTPEELYRMMHEEGDERFTPLAGVNSTTTSAADGNVLTSSHTTQQSRHSPPDQSPSVMTNNTAHTAAQNTPDRACVRQNSSGGSSDDDSEEIDMGERWWVRAQHRPRLPSIATLDETVSDKTSSVRFSPEHEGTEEEGKLFQLHFKVLEKIGFGGEGSVFCVEHRVTHARYAIKAILIHERDEKRVVQEAVLHSSFDNANVVRFYFCWIEDIAVSIADRLQLCNLNEDALDTMSMGGSDASLPTSSPVDDTLTDYDGDDSTIGDSYHMLFIQMEFFPRGTLADWLRSRKGFYRLEVLRYMQNIADGLAYLHNQDVVHRDLKPTNIFVSNSNVLKIGDFGLAKRRIPTTSSSNSDLTSNVVGQQQERSVVGGSPLYCSPEQTRGDPVNKPADIFSFGVIAVEMFCTFATLHERIRILTDAHQGVLPEEIERDFAEEVQIIKPLLAAEPQQRPSLRKVQRQLMRLIVTLEDSEQDAENVPHSPAETVGPSQLAPPVGESNAQTHHTPTTNGASDSTGVTTVGVPSEDSSPLQHTSTTASSASRKPATAHVLPPRSAAGSPVTHTPLPYAFPSTDQTDAHARPLPEWRGADAATPSPPPFAASTPQSQPPQQNHFARQSSTLSAHSASFAKHRNSYHDRRYASINSSPGAEAAAAATASTSSPETPSRGGASSASPAELIVTDPYGPPTTPVTYVGDADLSSILKRDLQDRTISPPD
ncbi:putative protein kinase putativeeukaryotic translation initiation factor 2-alpha kinase precursor [Leptomonas pyrrhocoris]|uniref:non-specific serine/threonine protein kinase n=1 Tax=Leptomonas pyrrhocoris TaxID=157538 RepID=A0A0M9G509_LEPPY|nr:putative protein kinase putativeeukaryotic translation initiation factor 2-alpha kinase precursor [Leptomonas pyrrhocoris]KPA82259.1 putative protein kinase putativeeukaryotic translation initiation factor 2-alpha kinase precursor [Leptomonas pyrrhocoris]|eukprot:XP_015660698.1 putative protein kinase putativeeukaryotic translation initiation factor 2-alpha kinase precursor [Leptomonas pyrrhocoris]